LQGPDRLVLGQADDVADLDLRRTCAHGQVDDLTLGHGRAERGVGRDHLARADRLIRLLVDVAGHEPELLELGLRVCDRHPLDGGGYLHVRGEQAERPRGP
jgi:hypothetical protein